MNIHSLERGDSLVLVIDGELDIATAPRLDQALARALATGIQELVVDLDQIGFVDSSGLHVLLKYVLLAGEADRRVRLTTGSPQVRRLLELSGLPGLLPFVEG